jgi:rod shape-determining protein MreC
MGRLLALLLKWRSEVLLVILLAIALGLTVTQSSHQKAVWLSSSNQFLGSIHSFKATTVSYFSLKKRNQQLQEDNAALRAALYQAQFEKALIDGSMLLSDSLNPYAVIPAKVVKNSVVRERNYLTLNKGTQQGVYADMGVITDQGVVGIIEQSSANFSTVLSLLHEDSSINASIKGSNYFGSLVWNGKRFDRCQLFDIPKTAEIQIGDSIVTGGMSSIFPPGILIGQVSQFTIVENSSFYTIEVSLSNNMANLSQVYTIDNRLKEERLTLEVQSND